MLRHGLVEPSFIPPRHQRELPGALWAMTRQRTSFVRGRATLVNRVQKVLEGTNLKLTAVVSNIAGVSGRASLAALLAGEEDVAVLADLAKGKLRKKRDELERALGGRLQPHHRFLLTELLAQIDGLDEAIARFDATIGRLCAVNEEAQVAALLDTIPGIGRAMGALLVAEIGVDMTKFPTPAHLAAWAGVAPGSNESAGRQRSGRTRKGNAWLKTALVQAAHGAARMKGTARAAKYRRVAARRGAKRAIMAVAHRLLIIAYHVIARREPYHELGPDYLERRRPAAVVDRLVQQLRQLGVNVTITTGAPSGGPPAGGVLAATP